MGAYSGPGKLTSAQEEKDWRRRRQASAEGAGVLAPKAPNLRRRRQNGAAGAKMMQKYAEDTKNIVEISIRKIWDSTWFWASQSNVGKSRINFFLKKFKKN